MRMLQVSGLIPTVCTNPTLLKLMIFLLLYLGWAQYNSSKKLTQQPHSDYLRTIVYVNLDDMKSLKKKKSPLTLNELNNVYRIEYKIALLSHHGETMVLQQQKILAKVVTQM